MRGVRILEIGAQRACEGFACKGLEHGGHAGGSHMQGFRVRMACGGFACRGLEQGVHTGVQCFSRAGSLSSLSP